MSFSFNIKFIHIFFLLSFFLSLTSSTFAQTSSSTIRMEFDDNLLTLSAKNADIKNILVRLNEKTGISVRFQKSLDKKITIELSGLTLSKALPRLLKDLNHAVIYSVSRKNRTTVSGVFVFKKSKNTRNSSQARNREKQITNQIRQYEKRIESEKKKLSKVNENSSQGQRYLRRIRSYENKIENLKRQIQ